MRRLRASLSALLVWAASAQAGTEAPGAFSFDNEGHYAVSLLTLTGDAFLVNVTIGGKGPYPFALDTGGTEAMDTALARELGLPVTETEAVQGAGAESVTAGLVTVPSFEIGHLSVQGRRFRVLDLGVPAQGYVPPYRGLLGHGVFDRLVVEIDQDHGAVVFRDPIGWAYRGEGKPVPIEFQGHLPVVSGAIDGVGGRFSLDTGQANSLTLFRPFLQREHLEARWPPRFAAAIGWGVGGDLAAEVARGSLLALGPVRVDRPVLYLSLQSAGAFADPGLAGNVGQGVFVRFDATFDYGHKTVWLERAGSYGREDDVHMMTLQRSFGGFTVLSVLPGGAAALAGLRPGDVIEEIDEREATRLEEDDLQRIFRRGPGSKVALQVRSEGHLRNLVVVLRPTL
jgi:hypothetical protein